MPSVLFHLALFSFWKQCNDEDIPFQTKAHHRECENTLQVSEIKSQLQFGGDPNQTVRFSTVLTSNEAFAKPRIQRYLRGLQRSLICSKKLPDCPCSATPWGQSVGAQARSLRASGRGRATWLEAHTIAGGCAGALALGGEGRTVGNNQTVITMIGVHN